MGLTKVKDLDKYFKHSKGSLVVTAKNVKALVPANYVDRRLLVIENETTCLGIMKLIINGTSYSTLMMLSMLTMKPSSTGKVAIDGVDYIELNFNKDDIFIITTAIVKMSDVAYNVFVSFLALGYMPSYIDYRASQALFNNDTKLCAINLGINHTIYEVIFSHMYRDAKDPFNFYRYTAMKDDPTIVSLHQVSHGPQSSSARIFGAYMADGITSSLTNDNDEPSVLENIMRA